MSRGPRAEGAHRSWGTQDSDCSILHVDMDAFFASVEVARRPHLRGLPVIVAGSERAVVLAATYEARAFGVRSAMPVGAARRLCPQAVYIPPDHAAYRAASEELMEILREVTTLVEPISVDEAFLDVSGARRRLGSSTSIARQIRERVQARLGITCSVGVASSKFVAKLASTHAKPDGMMLIPRDATVAFLRTLPVGALWGVGGKTEENLARWGISTVAELADTDPMVLRQILGEAAGAHLHDLAWGRDARPVEPTRTEQSIGAETTFATDVYDMSFVESKLLDLADRCAHRLRAQEVLARTVSVKVRTSDFRTLTRSRSLVSPSDSGHEIYLVARELVSSVDLRGLPVRLVGVRGEGLERRSTAVLQLTLEDAVGGKTEQQRLADAAMDQVRMRFGRSAIRPAASGRGPTTVLPQVELS
ncbi:DNA polymerase-4 [Sanguibacter gelidistatuariae]|uniref:DNA polymerase IV n=1 Tax=Sanguibacter gelidistatuariae TaxID=1814289 RepID=A0A1G6NW65_9MICO|nr:DNA polymerase IV [Sanguibacter gelidistatuariae]SDC72270.1 DNA polymerase-4 [Sanguibacter gelidistatuariae]